MKLTARLTFAAVDQRGIFITGASGYVGRALTARLAAEGDGPLRVWAPTRTDFDLTKDFAKATPPFPISSVVHLAASRDRSDGDVSRYPEEVRINVDATARLYEWARTHGVKSIVHVSTISVLEPSSDLKERIDEDADLDLPAHPYALTKRWGEELAEALIDEFESVSIVRPGMIYGPNLPERSTIAQMIASLGRTDDPRPLAAPRGNVFAPVYVDDVADVLARLVLEPKNIVLNVAGPDAVFEIEMLRDLGVRLGKAPAYALDRDAEPVALAPSTARIDKLYPSRVRTSWADGIAKAFESRQNDESGTSR